MNFIDKNKVKECISVEDVAEKYSTQIQTKSNIVYFICPFHQDKHLGSCYIRKGHKGFICKACGTGGDMLKLASGFTGIDINSMNELLERLVADFGIPRDSVLNNENQYSAYSNYRKVQTLTDEEYIRLTGVSVIKSIKEERIEELNGQNFKVPVQYDWVYLRSLAKRDPVRYDFELITRSRAIWIKLLHLRFKAEKDHNENHRILDMLKRLNIDDDNYSGINAELFSRIKKPTNAADLIEAMIIDGENLLKRGLLNDQSFDEELTLRKGITQRETAKWKIISKVI